MKKSALTLASLLLAFTGCGHGWLPFLNRGGSCLQGGCRNAVSAIPARSGDCSTCGDLAGNGFVGNETVSAGFSGIGNAALPYDRQVLSSESVLGGSIYDGGLATPGVVPGSVYESPSVQPQ